MARHTTMCPKEARTRLLLAPMTFHPLAFSPSRYVYPLTARLFVSSMLLYLRYFFLKFLFFFPFGATISLQQDHCHHPAKTTMCISKVNYPPLRRFPYPFGVDMTIRRDCIMYIYIYKHIRLMSQKFKDPFLF